MVWFIEVTTHVTGLDVVAESWACSDVVGEIIRFKTGG
jgi:hypothetical protein